MKRSTRNTILAGMFTISATILAGLFSVYCSKDMDDNNNITSNKTIFVDNNIGNINIDNSMQNNTYENITENKEKFENNTELIKSNRSEENSIINLCDLKKSNYRFFELNQGEAIEDTVGNRYTDSNLFVIYAEGKEKYGNGIFYLGRQYKTISGTIAVSSESPESDSGLLEGWIEIGERNKDNYTKLWETPMLNRITEPIEIPEIDLTKSSFLEIRFYTKEDYYSLAGGYHSLKIILYNIKLKKNKTYVKM